MMYKQIYTGTDTPVSLSITNLVTGSAVVICLGITSIAKDDGSEEYSYTMIHGMTDDATFAGIIGILCEHKCLTLIDDKFKSALAGYYPEYSRSHLISAIIRSRYSADDVEAIILNHGDGDAEHQQDYDKLQQWRRMAKEIAG